MKPSEKTNGELAQRLETHIVPVSGCVGSRALGLEIAVDMGEAARRLRRREMKERIKGFSQVIGEMRSHERGSAKDAWYTPAKWRELCDTLEAAHKNDIRKAKRMRRSERKSGGKPDSMLTMWEWETLVASWRYYEHRHTIASAMFPGDIVKRFWGKGTKATDDDRKRIATQFVCTDHRKGPDDKFDGWPLDGATFGGVDAKPWRKLWFFLDAVANGRFWNIHGVGNGTDKWHVCFDCDGLWVPQVKYISNPEQDIYITPEYVKERLLLNQDCQFMSSSSAETPKDKGR